MTHRQSDDIIGDIHGCNLTLVKLLSDFGYRQDVDGVNQHAERKVIFLGDYIDQIIPFDLDAPAEFMIPNQSCPGIN